jgi:hypothetical protein
MNWMQTHTQRQKAQEDHGGRYHKGFLLKRGKLVHSWKRRYFELIGSLLHYYESPMYSHQTGKEFHKQVGGPDYHPFLTCVYKVVIVPGSAQAVEHAEGLTECGTNHPFKVCAPVLLCCAHVLVPLQFQTTKGRYFVVSADSTAEKTQWIEAMNGAEQSSRSEQVKSITGQAVSRLSRLLSSKPSEEGVEESCVGLLFKRSRFYKEWRERFLCLKGLRLELREKEKADLRSVRRVSSRAHLLLLHPLTADLLL